MFNRGGKNAIFCNCRLRMVMKYTTRTENPGRLFYGCPNYEYGIDCNFFCWVNVGKEPVCVTPISQKNLHEFNWKMTNLESDVKTLKMMTMVTFLKVENIF
ncbi:hypothetical protein Ahy_A06g026140 [Arachis hypogaea]|uniref:GRF-type domain-containing protein n=1 Tax=Arachis hypogaea TaxID=3818 RepID=A0A445CJJ4_ARAHY|nr:hypothetical protein Ahy_A06g026140 [Arachis hypogaea]